MVSFLDGPAQGVHLTLQRTPTYLRVVRRSEAGKFVWDALDQLTDTPQLDETCFAYCLVGGTGVCHIDYTEKGKRKGLWCKVATYCVCDPQPNDETMRDTSLWRAWCYAERDRELQRGKQ